MPNLDVDLLRAFSAIAETGSFTRAAELTFRTQSAVSMQMKRLEQSIGRTLFNRRPRALTLTPDGEVLLEYTHRILRLHDEAIARLREPEVAGTVRLGVTFDYAESLLPVVLAKFAQVFPQVHVDVICDYAVNLVRHVSDKRLDLALVSQRPGEGGGKLVRQEPLVWVASSTYIPRRNQPVPLALYPQRSYWHGWAIEALDAAGIPWRIAYTSASHAGLESAVRSGLAVALLARFSVPADFRILDADEGFPSLPWVEMVLHDAPGSSRPAAERLAGHIVESLSGHAPTESVTQGEAAAQPLADTITTPDTIEPL
jgi:DNA-binding transcriptional LysR family regulator